MCANDLKRPGVQRAHRLTPATWYLRQAQIVGRIDRARAPDSTYLGSPEVDTGGREAPGRALRKGPLADLSAFILPYQPVVKVRVAKIPLATKTKSP